MKIGIIIFHWATNYGAILQSYALQQYLISIGHEVEIINYKPRKYDFSWFTLIRHPKSIFKIKQILINNKKETLLTLFRNQYLNQTCRFNSYDELKKNKFDYDLFISGSDQILNPFFTLYGENKPTPSYYLDFVNSKKKIGYAVSFGCMEYPENAKKYAKDWINNFDKIGVRENTAKDILESLDFKKEVTLVPDPTILMGLRMFDEIKIQTPNISNYICVYVLRKHIEVQCDNVYYIDDYNNPMALESWLGYIKKARGFVTNSYHGMIMSILFHIPFAIYLEKEQEGGMNDRFITLLSLLGLEDRIINEDKDVFSVLDKKFNWEEIDSKLELFRKEGEWFLRL